MGEAGVGLESEVRGEFGEDLGSTVGGGAAEFFQVFGRGSGEKEAAVGSEKAVEFGGLAAGGDGEQQREGSGGKGEGAIGIGDDPKGLRVAAGGEINGGGREVDAGGLASGALLDFTQKKAFAAAEVEEMVGGGDVGEKEVEEGAGVAVIVEETAGEGSGFRIAGVGGAFVLGLEEVEVAGAGKVEGMAMGTEEGAVVRGKGLAAGADGAKERVEGGQRKQHSGKSMRGRGEYEH